MALFSSNVIRIMLSLLWGFKKLYIKIKLKSNRGSGTCGSTYRAMKRAMNVTLWMVYMVI